MSWTDERVALLKKLWGEGKTAAEIAKELGGVTRNAVIGKAHRLKLSSRVSPIQQNTKKVAPKKTEEAASSPKKQPVKREKKYEPAIDFSNHEGVTMDELKERMCRWPMGDPRDADFRFCGCQRLSGIPYCAEHAKVAYQPATRNRILQNVPVQQPKEEEQIIYKEAANG